MESPITVRSMMHFKQFPNLTATYRHYDIAVPYGSASSIQMDPGPIDKICFASGKTKLVVWAVSHCVSQSHLFAYTLEFTSSIYHLRIPFARTTLPKKSSIYFSAT